MVGARLLIAAFACQARWRFVTGAPVNKSPSTPLQRAPQAEAAKTNAPVVAETDARELGAPRTHAPVTYHSKSGNTSAICNDSVVTGLNRALRAAPEAGNLRGLQKLRTKRSTE